jgi:hypothetical protein
VLGTLTLPSAAPVDWETVAVSMVDGSSQLLIGDVGDNDRDRSEVTILVTSEPDTLSTNMDAGVVERIRFAHPDGPSDVEGMLVDPATGRLLLFTRAAERTDVSAIDLSEEAPEPVPVGSIDLNASVYAGLGAVRGVDVAPDGSVVLRLTDGVVWLPGAGSAIDAINGRPCLVPRPSEANGEGVAWSGSDLFFIGEGAQPELWRVARGES